MAQPDWPGTTGFPALPARAGYARKSIQLPFATANSETDAPELIWGTGSPEGVITGVVGDLYLQVDAGGWWQKATGTGNTGWVIVGTGFNAAAYGGRQANGSVAQAIKAAVAQAVAAGGGVINCRGFGGAFLVLDADICGGLAAYDRTPLTFLWGPQEVRIAVTQGLRSHHHHQMDGTLFIAKDASGARVTGTTMFQFDQGNVALGGPGNGVVTTASSAVITKVATGAPAWGFLEPDSPISVFGYVPVVGHDNTTLNGALNNSSTSITVVSTTGFPSSGYIRIETEVINYTSVNATQFQGCTRGFQGTTAASHVDTTAVERCVYQPFYVTPGGIAGNNITLDTAMDFSSTNGSIWIGALDITFSGTATFDGNKDPNVDDAANPYGIQIIGGRFCRIGPGIVFQHFDHGGYDLELCQDCAVDARHLDCGRIGSSLGAAGWVFAWNKRIDIIADVVDCNLGIVVDDRTTTPSIRDGPTQYSTVLVRTSRGTPCALEMSGTADCHGTVLVARDIGASTAAIKAEATQWITNGTPSNNVCRLGSIVGTAGFKGVSMDAGWASGSNMVVSETPILNHSLQDGNSLYTPPYGLFLTYSASMTPTPDRSEDFRVAATDGNAFTFANPASTSRTRARRLTITLTNSSGGTLGTISFGTDYQLTGAMDKPANGKSRKISFKWNESATKWQEEWRSVGDF